MRRLRILCEPRRALWRKVARLNDFDVRSALHHQLREAHGLPPNALIVDELGLCQGSVRVDVVLVNEHLHGFEIKADGDSLERLPRQVAIYGRALEIVSLVTAERHLARAEAIVPPWWGVAVATPRHGAVHIDWRRRADFNPGVEALALAQLLWRDEVVQCLTRLGFAPGIRSKPRHALWTRLADVLSLDELKCLVKSTLKRRGDWRSQRRDAAPNLLAGSRPSSCDG